MTHAMNHKLTARRFVENEIRIGMRHDAPNAPLAAERHGMGELQYQIYDGLNARLHAKRALRGFQFDIS